MTNMRAHRNVNFPALICTNDLLGKFYVMKFLSLDQDTHFNMLFHVGLLLSFHCQQAVDEAFLITVNSLMNVCAMLLSSGCFLL